MLMQSRADGRSRPSDASATPGTTRRAAPSTFRDRWHIAVPFLLTLFFVVAAEVLPQDYADASNDVGASWLANALLSVQAIAFAGVGVMILWKVPRHTIGVLFMSVGVFVSAYLVISRYQYYALEVRPDLGLPFGELGAWLQGWLYVPALGLVVMVVPQLFPNGHVVSRRWLPALWLSVVGSLGMCLTDMLRPGKIDTTDVMNPTGVDSGIYDVISKASVALFLVCATLGFLSLAARWRRAGLHERQQLKVFLFTAALMPVFVVVNGALNELGLKETNLAWLSFATATFAFLGLPIAVGISIVRHRLYDIDVVINRTVVYALLSATLLATYVGCVLLLQAVIDPAIGSSNVAVALSTLAVAALFRPARDRIQAVVDRRFFRRRYDGRRILEGFATRLRDEVDLDSVTQDLLATVRHTVQPTQVSLWVPEVTPSRNDSRTPGH